MFWITLFAVGVQSANVKERKTAFRVDFFGYKNYFPEKRILNGVVEIIKGVTQECCKIVYSRKKCLRKIIFMKLFFLKDTVISTGTEERRQKRRITFRACFASLTANHFHDDQSFERFGRNFQRGTQEW